MPHYECDKCGACCRGHLLVEAYSLDLRREPRLARADITAWTHDLHDRQLMAELDADDKCLILAGNCPCAFLTTDNLCAIYPTRPNVCVAMDAGNEQCQHARHEAGLAPLSPVTNDRSC